MTKERIGSSETLMAVSFVEMPGSPRYLWFSQLQSTKLSLFSLSNEIQDYQQIHPRSKN
jgi:hypothetical protein